MKLTTNPTTEKYLFDDYSLIEDTKYLQKEEDIEVFFKDSEELLGDREDGYSSKETFLVKINEKFYEVTVEADVYQGGRQDVGERLWHCDIENVAWKEVEKPQPLPRKTVTIEVNAPESWIAYLEQWLKEENYDFSIK